MAVKQVLPGELAEVEVAYNYIVPKQYAGAGDSVWICKECAEAPENWAHVVGADTCEKDIHDTFCAICNKQIILCKFIKKAEKCPEGCWSDQYALLDGEGIDMCDGALPAGAYQIW